MKKFKIIASNEQLYGIGINYKISGLECTKKFINDILCGDEPQMILTNHYYLKF